ncbi:MAG: DegT/DnrJ/EryC1/StrS family aminotransferase [Armatimonadetes bacterium]|nr:DegT/DnrJ/EryC1/StrS family aminotransferase [Armatimonadota bacterium]
MSIQMADLRAQHREIDEEIQAAVDGVFERCQFILGENVVALEHEIARLCGAKYGVAVASGTDAITIALVAVGVGPGDEVVTTPFTFVATTESVVIAGARPVYADIDPETFNIDPTAIHRAVTPKTRAILPVHLYGQCANTEAIMAIAAERGVPVVFDGAQAIGAVRNGRKIGEIGDAVTLSFFPTKNLGGCGDGGMILTNDEAIAAAAKSLRFHGMSESYTYGRVGFCSRLDELQAAILRVKLSKLDIWNERRRRNAALYNEALSGGPVHSPVEDPGNHHIYHQYTVRTPNRETVRAALKDAGVGSAVYYPAPLHVQEAYAFLGYKEGDFPEAERASREVLSIPVHPQISDDQVKRVAEALAGAKKIV